MPLDCLWPLAVKGLDSLTKTSDVIVTLLWHWHCFDSRTEEIVVNENDNENAPNYYWKIVIKVSYIKTYVNFTGGYSNIDKYSKDSGKVRLNNVSRQRRWLQIRCLHLFCKEPSRWNVWKQWFAAYTKFYNNIGTSPTSVDDRTP